jgi:hypothetical protein
MIADEINIVDDAELEGYESSGRKMVKPKASTKVQAMRVKSARGGSVSMPATTPPSNGPSIDEYTVPKVEPLKKLYVHIKNPDDQDSLLKLKQTCSDFPGINDIVLVLGADNKSAIKLPFRVDGSDALIGKLVKILGEDAVVLK